MSTLELKAEIIENISSIDDVKILEQIKQFLQIDKNDSDIRIFTPEERRRIEISLEQYRNGQYMTHEEAEKDLDKWFEEEEEKLRGL